MTRPRLLDLFCCEGGAGMGYHRAGFDVVGVDITPQPRYPFEFVQADALEYLAEHGSEFDATHASPPCQRYSALSSLHDPAAHPDLVDPTRAALIATGLPWIMENVPGAPMPSAVMLCGSMFGLGAECRDGWRVLRRHRLFEHHRDVDAWPPYTCECASARIVGVYGHGGGGGMTRGYKGDLAESLAAIGAPWMSRHGVSQSIPPAYTEWLGQALMTCVLTSRAVT